MQLQRVCGDTLPWLISFSLDLSRAWTIHDSTCRWLFAQNPTKYKVGNQAWDSQTYSAAIEKENRLLLTTKQESKSTSPTALPARSNRGIAQDDRQKPCRVLAKTARALKYRAEITKGEHARIKPACLQSTYE